MDFEGTRLHPQASQDGDFVVAPAFRDGNGRRTLVPAESLSRDDKDFSADMWVAPVEPDGGGGMVPPSLVDAHLSSAM